MIKKILPPLFLLLAFLNSGDVIGSEQSGCINRKKPSVVDSSDTQAVVKEAAIDIVLQNHSDFNGAYLRHCVDNGLPCNISIFECMLNAIKRRHISKFSLSMFLIRHYIDVYNLQITDMDGTSRFEKSYEKVFDAAYAYLEEIGLVGEQAWKEQEVKLREQSRAREEKKKERKKVNESQPTTK